MSRRALLSVSDKSGVVEFARALVGLGFEILSTGGTLRTLRQARVPAVQVAEFTGQPEVFGGRVKTLHPRVFGGILQRRDDPGDRTEAARADIPPIEVLACNLYPFAESLMAGGERDELVEQIDIGGPALIRAGAKNSDSVFVATDPADYPAILGALTDESDAAELRRNLAAKAFAVTAGYDALIALWWASAAQEAPPRMVLPLEKVRDLRYGENPHQGLAAQYRIGPGLEGAGFRQLLGPAPSYNNILDLESAWATASDFSDPACAAIKHGNPCGLAIHAEQAEAFASARAGDPQAIYGGVVAFNRPLQLATVAAMRRVFLEVVVAPEVEPDALERLARRRNVRVFARAEGRSALDGTAFAGIAVTGSGNGVLIQERDLAPDPEGEYATVTARRPDRAELDDLRFAARAVKHVKSNAIVIARERALVGVGAGQMSRVRAVELAVEQAGARARGAVLASDAFFPFADGAQIALAAGVRAIIQPGGSKRDDEVIAACDRVGAAMVLSGRRHFRH
ncbi:MAG: bifunctional phosphoribosylaminoimidazolecarboxamide formyltransferase/IMP cyclohydrolase [Chloroflexota bacterium]|nr:bifunctional phosphoribosylaminoimidazolecarboxamide formyltransferase/IMP cyclohydrolase [Chloroflexota bacterium]